MAMLLRSTPIQSECRIIIIPEGFHNAKMREIFFRAQDCFLLGTRLHHYNKLMKDIQCCQTEKSGQEGLVMHSSLRGCQWHGFHQNARQLNQCSYDRIGI